MGKHAHLIGQRFSKGVVLNIAKKGACKRKCWELICDCGNTYYADTRSLHNGQRKSCGCLYRPNLIGQRFGKGIVIELVKDLKIKKQIWKLQCDCGGTFVASTAKLRNNHVSSCGCKVRPKEWGNLNGRLWDELKRNATRRKLEWNVSREYLWQLYLAQNAKCKLSGLSIKFARTNKEAQFKRTNTASLDRIDSSKGYIEGNVQWLHKNINMIKWAFTEERFIRYCRLIVRQADKNKMKMK